MSYEARDGKSSPQFGSVEKNLRQNSKPSRLAATTCRLASPAISELSCAASRDVLARFRAGKCLFFSRLGLVPSISFEHKKGPSPMARVTVDDCLEREENRFALVVLAAARTRQLMNGSHPLVPANNKPP